MLLKEELKALFIRTKFIVEQVINGELYLKKFLSKKRKNRI